MRLTYSQIRDIQGANIWVMDPNMQYVDDIKPMSENELYRVRGVEGVQWAVWWAISSAANAMPSTMPRYLATLPVSIFQAIQAMIEVTQNERWAELTLALR
jgi:hypothetical protein